MGACLAAELSKIKEHRVGLEPTLSLYESGVLAARRPVPIRCGADADRDLNAVQTDDRAGHPRSGTTGTRTLTRLGKNQGCCR